MWEVKKSECLGKRKHLTQILRRPLWESLIARTQEKWGFGKGKREREKCR